MKKAALWTLFLAACGTTQPAARTTIQPNPAAQARRQEAARHGCAEPCQQGVHQDQCQDEAGFCWSACAWNRCGHEPACRAEMDLAAEQTDHQVLRCSTEQQETILVLDRPYGQWLSRLWTKL
jgi:hypothetical protein